MRLNKYLSEIGLFSRREADKKIEAGLIFVNGERATLGMQIDPISDAVFYQDQALGQNSEKVYYALYKPSGVITTSSDPQGRKKITDFVPKTPRVYPVGRLDYDSEGLIILTNDGEITNKLTHPSFEHEKEYLVSVESKGCKCGPERIAEYFHKGIKIEEKIMRADSIHITTVDNTNLLIRVVLHTGYNRQIRKMCDKIGLKVKKLTRVRIGKLSLEKLSLHPGQYIEIDPTQIL